MRRTAFRAGGLAGAFLVVYVIAIMTPAGQEFDAASIGGFVWLPSGAHAIAGAVRDLTAVAAGVMLLAMLGWLLRVRRLADAVRVSVAAGGVAVLGELLKLYALPRPRLGEYGYPENTFPSVHAAFVTVVLMAALRVAPARWSPRPMRWAVCVVIFAAGLAGPLSYAHRASDSVGGILLAGVATLALVPANGSMMSHRATRLGALIATGAGIAGLVAAPIALVSASDGLIGVSVALLIASAAGWVVLASRGGEA